MPGNHSESPSSDLYEFAYNCVRYADFFESAVVDENASLDVVVKVWADLWMAFWHARHLIRRAESCFRSNVIDPAEDNLIRARNGRPFVWAGLTHTSAHAAVVTVAGAMLHRASEAAHPGTSRIPDAQTFDLVKAKDASSLRNWLASALTGDGFARFRDRFGPHLADYSPLYAELRIEKTLLEANERTAPASAKLAAESGTAAASPGQGEGDAGESKRPGKQEDRPATESAIIVEDEDSGLSDRQRSILETMLEHEIASERRRKKRAEIVRLINRTHKPGAYNKAFADLVTPREYLRSREGRSAGMWLTAKGITAAKQVKSANQESTR